MTLAVRYRTARTPIISAIDQWIAHNRRFSKVTQDKYKMVIQDFQRSLSVNSLGQLSHADIEVYITAKLSKMKNVSANGYINPLKSFFRWLSEQYDLPNIARNIRKLHAEPSEARCLTSEEYRNLIASNPVPDIFLFLANTALRATEFVSLKKTDIQGKWLRVHGKGRRLRHIPLNKTALETSHIIPFSKTRVALWQQCQRAAVLAGIKPFGPNALRHYCTTELLRKGVPIAKVAVFRGSSIAVTEKYYWHYQCHSLLDGVTDCLDL